MSKESRGIKTVGWIGIIVGAFLTFVLMIAVFLSVEVLTKRVGGKIEWYHTYSIALGICGLLCFIGSIQLVRLKESGRKLYFLLAFLLIVFNVYSYISGFSTFDIANKMDWLISFIPKLLLPIWIIYYFTRPKVKEQFK